MKINVGQFEGYLSDKNPTDIVLSLLSRLGSKHRINPSQLHSFIYDMKKQNSGLFEDIYFSETSVFPYSEELELAMRKLQSAGCIVRPNPKFASFTMRVNGPMDAEWMSQDDKNVIDNFAKAMADKLSQESAHARKK
jgi:hypothetical protein